MLENTHRHTSTGGTVSLGAPAGKTPFSIHQSSAIQDRTHKQSFFYTCEDTWWYNPIHVCPLFELYKQRSNVLSHALTHRDWAHKSQGRRYFAPSRNETVWQWDPIFKVLHSGKKGEFMGTLGHILKEACWKGSRLFKNVISRWCWFLHQHKSLQTIPILHIGDIIDLYTTSF